MGWLELIGCLRSLGRHHKSVENTWCPHWDRNIRISLPTLGQNAPCPQKCKTERHTRIESGAEQSVGNRSKSVEVTGISLTCVLPSGVHIICNSLALVLPGCRKGGHWVRRTPQTRRPPGAVSLRGQKSALCPDEEVLSFNCPVSGENAQFEASGQQTGFRPSMVYVNDVTSLQNSRQPPGPSPSPPSPPPVWPGVSSRFLQQGRDVPGCGYTPGTLGELAKRGKTEQNGKTGQNG